MIPWIIWLPLILTGTAACFAGQVPENAKCDSCHDQGKKLAASAHHEVTCDTCHEKHEVFPHPANVPKPACANCHADQAGEHAKSVHGQELKKGNTAAPDCGVCHGSAHELKALSSPGFRQNVPDTCGMCHSDIAEQFKASVHGKALARGIADAPMCTDCHGEHNIQPKKNPASPVAAGNIRETCGSCHGDVRLARKFGLPADRITTFDASFHGLAARGGSQTVANCASCHGIHNILPSSDAKSTINSANLAKTCGHCHPGAGSRFALGKIHMVEGVGEPSPVYWARIFYLFVIPATLGFMTLHHGGNWLRKLIRSRLFPTIPAPMPRPLAREFRMFKTERWQHFLLVTSFFMLAWTGFALKYPDWFWAKPLLHWESSWPVRGTLHRFAAVVMTAVALAHVVTLIASRRLREHWLDLFPTWRDVVDAAQGFAFNLGLRSRPPVLPHHSYVEKVEYWAVVWGTFIMGLTGLMLWANKYTLKWIPKEWLDTATSVHFYEAVLATLSIVIWHFYTVIFDPDIYPMDPAWLTGYSVRHRGTAHSEPAPAEKGQQQTES